MPSAEQYLKPEVIRRVARLDLRARFIVEGFLSGLHASPFHGFSVEFSEHRRYTQGDDPKNIDWLVYAKTDRYYIKKYQAETNITGYLLMDLSESMAYTYRQELTKFEYSVCLAAALAYLMVHQQDPIGLMTFDEKIQASLPARSRRSQLADILAVLAKAMPTGTTDVARNLRRFAAMVKHKSLVMLFSDLLTDTDEVINAIRMLRYGGTTSSCFTSSMKRKCSSRSTGCATFASRRAGRRYWSMPPECAATTSMPSTRCGSGIAENC